MKRTISDWIIASRPWSFSASLIPVIAISAYFYWANDGQGDWINAILALPMLICMQAAGNLIGDYFDHKNGVDLPGSLNGVRHIQSGKFTPKEILWYGITVLAIAAVIGLVILWRSDWSYIWLGAVGLAMTAFYPWLKYHALGDIDVLFGYALLPALGISCVVTGEYHWNAMLLSLPFGLLTVAILHANNTRDILNDRRAGIQTMCGAIGWRVSQWVYLIEVALAYVLLVLYCCLGWYPKLSLMAACVSATAFRNVRTMMKAQPQDSASIGDLDHMTALHQFGFGLLLTVTFILSSI